MRLRALLPLLLLVGACRTSAPVATPAAPRPPQAGTAAPVATSGTAPTAQPAAAAAQAVPATLAQRAVPESIRWVRRSAEHRALFLQVYGMATRRVEQEAARRSPGSWAVALDADETVIDNSPYQLERAQLALPFDAASWRAWTARREAPPLPGAAAFLSRVRELGGRIAIVTNRTQIECPDTEAVFRANALAYDVMLCRPDGSPGDKNPRFDAVTGGTTAAGLPPLEIVAFVGDNILDFPRLSQAVRKGDDAALSEFGRRFFLLPNPMYGSWERNEE
jgi:5'-nucleotidase (lipoprotein e(P4) family)